MESRSVVSKGEEGVGGWYCNKRAIGRILLVMELCCILTAAMSISK